ncbi:thiol:disulfide interchange protein DsbG [Acinetobacter sp. ANC 3882]|uniref:thiol:disulfide interchange protein DsbG n=1 Tax=Acinetobacter sp. ANC 3882 TaxID=2923423 RepID=UPI001F4B91BD|nr:thiol:disulfide interchange protein DsbG [Acinetobacter sp. ANC 3882]MCH7313225.1 thiol:disulfide interchange protein DsbG [Acinetobacter sp. ANC 3882]
MNRNFKFLAGLALSLSATQVFAAVPTIKQKLEKEGFTFVKQIEAPAQMTGWAGHMQQNPATVFISNDNKYYIIGDLHNAKGDNLTVDALNKHVKQSVLDDVWKSLAQSAWIQDGSVKAPRIIYVFSDPNCPYCHAFWEKARPYVKAGKVQLRHIQVGVIRPESRGQAATLLAASNPQQVFEAFNAAKGKQKLKELKPIPAHLAEKLERNEEMMNKYGFYATPALIWKNSQGKLETAQGLPKDVKGVFE